MGKSIFLILLAIFFISCEKEQPIEKEPEIEWFIILEEYPRPMYNYPHQVTATFFPNTMSIEYRWERKDKFLTQLFIYEKGEWKEIILTKLKPSNHEQ